ncbi:MAG: HAD-IA family hydrolase [Myxococcales bacterium FL481]|nr:MAG: HAD-IA family hydrolase [Myxococcales bacterium FL481]
MQFSRFPDRVSSSDAPLVIFDLDDTLIASFDGYVELHQRVAADLGWEIPTRQALIPYAQTWEATLERLFPERNLAPFFDRYEQIADDLPYPAIPGVTEALAQLRARAYSLWIVTKRTRRRLDQRLINAGISSDLFDGIFTNEQQPAPKPDPRCFDPIWQQIGGRAPAVYIGDRHEDRLAADAAGLTFVAVRTGPEADYAWVGELEDHRVLGSAADTPSWLSQHHRAVLNSAATPRKHR